MITTHAKDKPIEPQWLPWHKKILFGTLYAFVMVFTIAIIGECLLRVLPLGSYRSAPFRQYDPEVGLSLLPDMNVTHHRGCFAGEVVTNRWGMRDRERTLEKSPEEFRIAVLGDSAVEAVQVKPEEVVTRQMEQLLAAKGYKHVSVLNFAVEGIGTTQELIMYKEKVRQFHPDLVLVMFSWNDVMNNSSTLQPKSYGIHTWYSPYFDLGPDGKLSFRPVESRTFGSVRSYLERHSVLTYYLERMWLTVDLSPEKWKGIPIYFGTYGDPLDGEWNQAWLTTEKVMTLMRDTVVQDGSKFMLIAWPDFADIDPQWRARMIKQVGHVPSEFNPFKPEERIQSIAERNRIPFDFIAPYLRSYRDEHGLQWPYFSFTCDPHFSALGHRVSAEAIVQKLEQHELLPPPVGRGQSVAANHSAEGGNKLISSKQVTERKQ
jgi:hypothetical protein